MTYATAADRQAFINGLRELAGFLESNPHVPAPSDACVHVFPPHDALDSEKRREINRIASLIGSETETVDSHGHYRTVRWFGPLVQYRAVAVLKNTDKDA